MLALKNPNLIIDQCFLHWNCHFAAGYNSIVYLYW
jgi:hypothetical protein